MLKKYLKKLIPDRRKIIEHKALRIFGKLLHDPNFWHLNRYSVSRAFAVGLFFAWIPVPFQMILAAGAAILWRANLPISIALVWLTNPITMPPLFYFAYKVGTMILATPEQSFKFQMSLEWALSVGKPFIIGCLLCALVSSVIGVITIRLTWRYLTIKNWLKRKKKRARKNKI